jgi:hypothetical protein
MSRSELGPLSERLPAGGHPIGNAAVVGWALRDGVYVDGARVDALAAAAGAILRTSAASAHYYGLGFVLRVCESPALRLEHLLFAPQRPRPILFAHVILQNRLDEVLVVQYSELWDLACRAAIAHAGACSAHTERGLRVLAEVDAAIRAHAPEGLDRGLALDVRLALPPGAQRPLSFAYVLPDREDDHGSLVSAWRGRVQEELETTLAEFHARFADRSDPLGAYRAAFDGL